MRSRTRLQQLRGTSENQLYSSGGKWKWWGGVGWGRAEKGDGAHDALMRDSTRSWTGIGMCLSGGQTTFSMPASAGSSAIGDTELMMSALPRRCRCRPLDRRSVGRGNVR